MTNERIRNIRTDLLSDNWYILKRATFEYQRRDGSWQTQTRELYDRGNGAVILLYNPEKRTVVLTRQFRMPAYVNGHPDGMLIEACAGLLDEDDPEAAIRREAEEETGYRVERIEKVMEVFMSPGSVTERLHFFVARYDDDTQRSDGSGVEAEGEDIEVLELPFSQAMDMIASGEIIDAKTIMLLQYARLHNLIPA
ncbi:MAG: GDP-mannose pyrophosphatase NudK [Chloroflexota bacterium]|nr:MAG: GDP-mannose pyrophosphatase NudK [Chloroflexota bacterium]